MIQEWIEHFTNNMTTNQQIGCAVITTLALAYVIWTAKRHP